MDECYIGDKEVEYEKEYRNLRIFFFVDGFTVHFDGVFLL